MIVVPSECTILPLQVDYPRKKNFEEAIDKAGIAVYVRKNNKKPSVSHYTIGRASCILYPALLMQSKPLERRALLEEKEDFSVDEPEDDMPPPDYKDTRPVV